MSQRTQSMQSVSYNNLLEVMHKVEKTHIQPLGYIRPQAGQVDVYA